LNKMGHARGDTSDQINGKRKSAFRMAEVVKRIVIKRGGNNDPRRKKRGGTVRSGDRPAKMV